MPEMMLSKIRLTMAVIGLASIISTTGCSSNIGTSEGRSSQDPGISGVSLQTDGSGDSATKLASTMSWAQFKELDRDMTNSGDLATILAIDASQASASTVFYGKRKGIEDAGGESHHYVEFDVYMCTSSRNWRVQGPLNPQLWVLPPPDVSTVRAYYSLPWNLPDPYSPSEWRLYLE